MNFSRRDVLKMLPLIALPGGFFQACARAVRVPSSLAPSDTLLLPMAGVLGIFRDGELLQVPIPNVNPHSVIVNPAHPRFALVIDQFN